MLIKLFLLHYLADFILQPREMGEKKSSELKWLLGHLAIQFVVFAPFTSIGFALANCAVHGVIDSFIWKGYKALAYYRLKRAEAKGEKHPLMVGTEYQYWKDKVFFDTIGFDQMLHAITLVALASVML